MSQSALSLSLPSGEYEAQRKRLDIAPGYLLRCDVVTITDHTERDRVLGLARACLLAIDGDDGASDFAHKIRKGIERIGPTTVDMNILNAVKLGGAVLLRSGQPRASAGSAPEDEGLLVPLAEATRRALVPYSSVDEAVESMGSSLPHDDTEVPPILVSDLRAALDNAIHDLFPVRPSAS